MCVTSPTIPSTQSPISRGAEPESLRPCCHHPYVGRRGCRIRLALLPEWRPWNEPRCAAFLRLLQGVLQRQGVREHVHKPCLRVPCQRRVRVRSLTSAVNAQPSCSTCPCLSPEAGEPNSARVELFSLDPAPGSFCQPPSGIYRGMAARPETRGAKLKSAIISTVLWLVIVVPFVAVSMPVRNG